VRGFKAASPVLVFIGVIVVLSFVLPAFADLGWNKAFV